MKQIVRDCSVSSGVDQEKVSNMLKTLTVTDESEKICEFTECFYKKVGYKDASGNFDFAKIEQSLKRRTSEENVQHILSHCKELQGDSKCALKFTKCAWTHFKKYDIQLN